MTSRSSKDESELEQLGQRMLRLMCDQMSNKVVCRICPVDSCSHTIKRDPCGERLFRWAMTTSNPVRQIADRIREHTAWGADKTIQNIIEHFMLMTEKEMAARVRELSQEKRFWIAVSLPAARHYDTREDARQQAQELAMEYDVSEVIVAEVVERVERAPVTTRVVELGAEEDAE